MNFSIVLIVIIIDTAHGQKRKCPDGSNSDQYCCLAVEADSANYLRAEIDEDALLNERVTFITEEGERSSSLPFYTDSNVDMGLYTLSLSTSFQVRQDDYCAVFGLCATSYFTTDSTNLILSASGNGLHLFPLGGPNFELTLTCQYDDEPEQVYNIELLINEKDGARYHAAPIIASLSDTIVEIPEGIYRPPNNLILSASELQFSSEDKIRVENIDQPISITTDPEGYASRFEVTNLVRLASTQTAFAPNEIRANFSAELRIIEPIYNEEEIDVCLTIATFIERRTQRQSSRECFTIRLINEDNHPPLFCTVDQIESSRTCPPRIREVTVKLADVQNGYQLPMERIEAIDGDLIEPSILYELIQPDTGFSLVNSRLVVSNMSDVKMDKENTIVVVARQANNANMLSTQTIVVSIDQSSPPFNFTTPDEIKLSSLGPVENVPFQVIDPDDGSLAAYLDDLELKNINYEFLWTIDSDYLTVSNGNGTLFYANPVTASRIDQTEITLRLLVKETIVGEATQIIRVEFTVTETTTNPEITTLLTTTNGGDENETMPASEIGLLVGLCILLVIVITTLIIYCIKSKNSSEVLDEKDALTNLAPSSPVEIVAEEAHVKRTSQPTPPQPIGLQHPALHSLDAYSMCEFVFGATIRPGKSVTIKLARLKTTDKFDMIAHKYDLALITPEEQEQLKGKIERYNVTRQWRHENLLHNFGTGIMSSHLVIFTENAHLGSLLDVFRSSTDSHWKRIKSFSRAQLLKFITGVTAALEFLHEKNIIHGELRASNVMVDQDYRPKLRIGAGNGTDRRYWSVEMFEQATHTCESDIWALGVLMWEILSLGSVPYESVDDIQTFLQVERLAMPDNASADLYALMTACWNVNPRVRPTAKQIRIRLDRSLKSEVLSSAPRGTKTFNPTRQTVKVSPVTSSGDEF